MPVLIADETSYRVLQQVSATRTEKASIPRCGKPPIWGGDLLSMWDALGVEKPSQRARNPEMGAEPLFPLGPENDTSEWNDHPVPKTDHPLLLQLQQPTPQADRGQGLQGSCSRLSGSFTS